MKPLRLHLGGFSCFREPVEVRFDDLELFAISGPTGSGKTTLLDAITYALYGQTPRLGGRPTSQLISPGLVQLFVTFEFSLDAGRTYRVTRVAERKGARSPKSETRLEVLDGGVWRQLRESEKLKEADAKLVELVGLDYESFIRAVLLPQGAFDQFLRGGAAERNRLLASLLGLEKLRAMQQLAGERARSAEVRAAGLCERLEQDYAGASPERQRELEDELQGLQAQRQELDGARTRLAEELQDLEEVKGLVSDLAEVQRRLGTLQAQDEAISQARAQLQAAKDAALLLPQLEAFEEGERKQAQLETQQRSLAEGLARAESELASAQRQRDEAERAVGRLSEIAVQLEALAEVRPLLAQLVGRGGTLALAEEAVAGAAYDDAAWDALQSLKAQLPALKRALADVSEAEKALAAAKASAEAAGKQVEALSAELASVKAQGTAARERLNQAEARYRQAEVEDRAAALRPHLHVGEACPVCRQPVAVLPEVEGVDLVPLAAVRDEAKRAVDELLERHSRVAARLETARSRLQDRQAEVEKAEAALTRQRARLAENEAAFAALGVSAPEAIETALASRQRALLAALAAKVHDRAGGRDPEAAYAELTAERERLEQDLKAAQGRLQAAERRLHQVQADKAALEARLADLAEEVAAARERFGAALERTGFASAQALREAALDEARLNALEGRLKSHESQLELFSRKEVELQAKLAGRTLDEDAYQAAKARKLELDEALGRVQERMGELGAERKRLAEQLEKAKALREEAAQLDREARTYKALHQDLRSDRLQGYLLSRVQQQLAHRASTIVREVSEGRYDLVFADGEYGVLDAWGGGEIRSARTLSGGESFIASLALALALSDTLAGHASLGALFLDEGFGTLDAETLDAVSAVLQALTQQGRMVGVITHVAALSERMPARLLVQKGAEGSTVAWE